MGGAVVFDGDDTLWSTEPLYDTARAAARRLVEEAGHDGARWEAIEREVDVRNVEVLGHSPARFPASCVEALELAAAEAGGPPPGDALRAAVQAAAAEVFHREAPVRPGARAVLAALRARGHRLALVTKGDPGVQAARVAASGLADLFDVVRVVDAKTPDVLLDVVAELGVPAARAVSVGNSVRSDVLPSVAAGLRAVWVPAHVWEYERAHDHLVPEGVDIVPSLDALLDVLA